ncbi:MAG: MFS transporter [Verrucomicrobiales bacterium]|jgi:MFS family permease|nr:MFS transporter [Verrucomicrobiales bacterium]
MNDKTWRCGSLTYTKPALLILFFWLLWGDFCYTLMEAVVPSIMPLKFKELGASDWEIGLILGSAPSLVYSLLNPVISFKSDRFRSRWGRRIPFIVFSLPFIVLLLAVLGFGDKLGFWLHGHLGATIEHISPSTFAIWFIGAMMIVFTVFNTFVTSTFWYLFNDVVPEHLLARFMSWFRVISQIAACLYNVLVFPYATSHYLWILLGAAALYLFGFGLMCLFVREGNYPPPPAYVGGATGPVAAVKTYAEECLGVKHYWWQWLASFNGAIGGGMVTFAVFFNLSVGLTMQQIGFINGTLSIMVAVFVLGTGWLADRYHPIRVVLGGSLLGIVTNLVSIYVWLVWRPAAAQSFPVLMAITFGLTAPCAALWAMGDPPLLMRMFPRTHYGQFCSFNGVCRAIGGILGGFVAGLFLDVLGKYLGDKQEAYRYIPVWSLCFAGPGLLFNLMLFRSWLKLGGDQNYQPPMLADRRR